MVFLQEKYSHCSFGKEDGLGAEELAFIVWCELMHLCAHIADGSDSWQCGGIESVLF